MYLLEDGEWNHSQNENGGYYTSRVPVIQAPKSAMMHWNDRFSGGDAVMSELVRGRTLYLYPECPD
jgi:hypothetical protein